jgi:hypothetical protein
MSHLKYTAHQYYIRKHCTLTTKACSTPAAQSGSIAVHKASAVIKNGYEIEVR